MEDSFTKGKSGLEQKTARNLTRLYIAALSIVAILTISGQFLIRHAINDQLNDSRIINLAGTQRYKSQQICKLSLLLYSDIHHPSYPDKIKSINHLLSQWKQGHNGLQHGDMQLNLLGNNSEKIREMYKDINPYFLTIYSNVTDLIKLRQSGIKENEKAKMALDNILNNENIFLEKMDAIVYQYDLEAKEKVLFLKNIEGILLLLTLVTLLLEGFFVFKPAANKIKETIRDLIQSEENAYQLSQRLTISNNSLEQSLKELKNINIALDHATILAKTDRYGVINYVNEKFCEISRYSKEELIGQRFNLLSGHYHSKAFFDNLWETISTGKIWNNEVKNRAKDGSYFWLDATIVPVVGNDNTPIEYIAIYTDVTQRFKQSINEQKIRSSSIIEGQEKERRKIARELHDGLGQMLTGLKFSIEGLKGAPSKQEKTLLDDIRKMIFETIAEVRKISFNLMPTVLSDFGIAPALKHLSELVSKSSPTCVIYEDNSDFGRLSKQVEINIYRIVQEALDNAIKYADANEVRVKLTNTKENLNLEISDNGKGFSTQQIPANGTNKKKDLSGNGIINIQERTSLIDGHFRIETAPGMGTKLFIKVPLHNNG